MKKIIIYTRVSTKDQTTESQILKLDEYCKNHDYKVVAKYEDIGTGKNTKRPNYQKLLNDIHLKSFDILLVWKLDRLSRSLQDLMNLGELLKVKEIDLITYDNAIDTTSPTGKLMFQVMGAFAEFNRNLIAENVKAGMEKARAKGVKVGRPQTQQKKLTKKVLEVAYSMKTAQKMSYRDIAKELNIKNHSSLYQALKKYEENLKSNKNNSTNIYDFLPNT